MKENKLKLCIANNNYLTNKSLVFCKAHSFYNGLSIKSDRIITIFF